MMNEQERKVATKILGAYEDKQETALDRLKKTHAKAQKPALVFGYVFGGISALIMGAGMSLVMTDFIGLGNTVSMVVGIIAGVVGMGMAALTYPIYKRILAKSKKKYAAEMQAYKAELLGE